MEVCGRSRSRFLHALVSLLLVSLALTGCGPAAQSSSMPPTESVSQSPVVASPTSDTSSPTSHTSSAVGLIAIGHSGLTGEGTPGTPQEARENSWATGTSTEVNSIYLRLVEIRPETQGEVANTASGGARVFALPDQAQAALEIVRSPALVIISTIDNDIRCDGTDAEHFGEFGMYVADALEAITAAAPNARILVVGQFGRPEPAFVEELVAEHPAVKASLTGTGICDFYNPAGDLVEDNFETLTTIIEGYEAEEARVCSLVPQCRTDGGVRAAYVDTLENYAPDFAHLNVRGQAAQAELMWPVAVELLGL